MDSESVMQGDDLDIVVTVKDTDGVPVTTYDGSQALTTTCWPGGDRSASFTATTTWLDPTQGTIVISFTGVETLTLDPGRYQIATKLLDAGRKVPVYKCTLDVTEAPGVMTAPKVYTNYNDLLLYARSWLKDLQTDDDQAGFAEQQARARTWLESIAHAHYRVGVMTMVVGTQAMGPRRSGARSVWLQEQLDAGKLMVTDDIREACAKKALAYVCESQVGLDEKDRYAKHARRYHSQAQAVLLERVNVLQLDTDDDGFADVVIDVTSSDPL